MCMCPLCVLNVMREGLLVVGVCAVYCVGVCVSWRIIFHRCPSLHYPIIPPPSSPQQIEKWTFYLCPLQPSKYCDYGAFRLFVTCSIEFFPLIYVCGLWCTKSVAVAILLSVVWQIWQFGNFLLTIIFFGNFCPFCWQIPSADFLLVYSHPNALQHVTKSAVKGVEFEEEKYLETFKPWKSL